MTTLKTESAHAAQPPTTAKPVKGKAKNLTAQHGPG